jgi:hypothetical protein
MPGSRLHGCRVLANTLAGAVPWFNRCTRSRCISFQGSRYAEHAIGVRIKSLTQNELGDFRYLYMHLVGERDGAPRCGTKNTLQQYYRDGLAMQATR